MEAAIENAAQQTAQDLHLLLDQANPSRPPLAPQQQPPGKENRAPPAAGQGKKTVKVPLGSASLSLQGQPLILCLLPL